MRIELDISTATADELWSVITLLNLEMNRKREENKKWEENNKWLRGGDANKNSSNS